MNLAGRLKDERTTNNLTRVDGRLATEQRTWRRRSQASTRNDERSGKVGRIATNDRRHPTAERGEELKRSNLHSRKLLVNCVRRPVVVAARGGRHLSDRYTYHSRHERTLLPRRRQPYESIKDRRNCRSDPSSRTSVGSGTREKNCGSHRGAIQRPEAIDLYLSGGIQTATRVSISISSRGDYCRRLENICLLCSKTFVIIFFQILFAIFPT